ncbi:MAG: MBL fold metallo-hydrolase [bacterium]|nr:MBL fold metallo-hydrolase [bacterium]
MGPIDYGELDVVNGTERSPRDDEIELTLFGPGYGESMVLHLGNGVWVVVDSCVDSTGAPAALRYLERIGVDSAESVNVVFATHWHDDHIRGLVDILAAAPNADFCCASALCTSEFLGMVGALETGHFSVGGSGMRELHGVFSLLVDRGKEPIHAIANRMVYCNPDCEVWSLSPSDSVFQTFLKALHGLMPKEREAKNRVRDLSPNEAAVVLWVEAKGTSLLLGSDMERGGWSLILSDTTRPVGRASVFKVPHHGSGNAHVPEVWDSMVEKEAAAILAPWRRGGHALPTTQDAKRILNETTRAWITRSGSSKQLSFKHPNRTVEKTLRQGVVRLQRLPDSYHRIRLRRQFDSSDPWSVELFGDASHLSAYAA